MEGDDNVGELTVPFAAAAPITCQLRDNGHMNLAAEVRVRGWRRALARLSECDTRRDGPTGPAWGDWVSYTDSPLRAFESELGVQALAGFWEPAGLGKDGGSEAFMGRRATEIMHGRTSMWAMMATIGTLPQDDSKFAPAGEYEKRKWSLNADIASGRLASAALIGMVFQEGVVGCTGIAGFCDPPGLCDGITVTGFKCLLAQSPQLAALIEARLGGNRGIEEWKSAPAEVRSGTCASGRRRDASRVTACRDIAAALGRTAATVIVSSAASSAAGIPQTSQQSCTVHGNGHGDPNSSGLHRLPKASGAWSSAFLVASAPIVGGPIRGGWECFNALQPFFERNARSAPRVSMMW
jgi:hypothetical protein